MMYPRIVRMHVFILQYRERRLSDLLRYIERSEYHTQLAKVSFDEIFDLAGVYFNFYDKLICCRHQYFTARL